MNPAERRGLTNTRPRAGSRLALAAAGAAVLTSVVSAAVTPTKLQTDTYIRFSRVGYQGNLYLNKDGSYVIVQTDPRGITGALTGEWKPEGREGFCLSVDGNPRALCFAHTPARTGQRGRMVSEDGKVYEVQLHKGR